MRYPNAQISVVGPVTFEIKKENPIIQQDSKVVLFFDVTPFDNLEYDSFYTFKMCSETINDLIEVAADLGVSLHLKPKRPYLLDNRAKVQHSESYVNLVLKLESENLLKLLDFREEIESLIGSSQVVVGVPFTSPVFVSAKLNRPSFYYIPLDVGNWEIPLERDGILVIRGKTNLKDQLKAVMIGEN